VRKKAQPFFADGPDQETSTQLPGRLQFVDQSPLHLIALALIHGGLCRRRGTHNTVNDFVNSGSQGLLINVETGNDRLAQGRPDPLVHLLCQRFSQPGMAGQGPTQGGDSTRVFNQPPYALQTDPG
jgi:hypothetical protein